MCGGWGWGEAHKRNVGKKKNLNSRKLAFRKQYINISAISNEKHPSGKKELIYILHSSIVVSTMINKSYLEEAIKV